MVCRYLNDNYFTGGVPAQLANLTNLEILYVSLLFFGILKTDNVHVIESYSLFSPFFFCNEVDGSDFFLFLFGSGIYHTTRCPE